MLDTERLEELTDEEIDLLPGIYVISCPITREAYVGMTATSFSSRLRNHFKNLDNGSHYCRMLQRRYDELGSEYLRIKCAPCLATGKELRRWERLAMDVYSEQGWTILNRTKSGRPINRELDLMDWFRELAEAATG